jgi:hypothetical protein
MTSSDVCGGRFRIPRTALDEAKSPKAQTIKVKVHNRRRIKSQHLTDYQTADDRYAQWPAQLEILVLNTPGSTEPVDVRLVVAVLEPPVDCVPRSH